MVELIVRGAERPATARALLDAAARLGLPARVVASTSSGYLVPERVAAGAVMAVSAGVNPLPDPDPDEPAAPAAETVPEPGAQGDNPPQEGSGGGEDAPPGGGGTEDRPLPRKKPQKASQPRGKRTQ